jgi:hypothetical protein
MSEFDRKLSRALGYVNEGRDDMLRAMLAKMEPELAASRKSSFAKVAHQKSDQVRSLDHLAAEIQKGLVTRDTGENMRGLDSSGKFDEFGAAHRLRSDSRTIAGDEAMKRAREYVDLRYGGDASLLTNRDYDEARQEAENS